MYKNTLVHRRSGGGWFIALNKFYSTTTKPANQQVIQSSSSTSSTPTVPLDYDVKAERKQTKKDMRGLSDKFLVPPQVGIDDGQYIKAMETLEQIRQENGSEEYVSFSLELKQIEQDMQDHIKQEHHHKKRGGQPQQTSPIKNVPSKDTTINED